MINLSEHSLGVRDWVLLATNAKYKNKSGLNNEEYLLSSLKISSQGRQFQGWAQSLNNVNDPVSCHHSPSPHYFGSLLDDPKVPGSHIDITTYG